MRLQLLVGGCGADGQPTLWGLRVQDGGIGLTPAQLARVSGRCFRADTSCDIPGTGLGMRTVKETKAPLGGRLDLACVAGQGTAVTLWLPALQRRPRRPRQHRPRRQWRPCTEGSAMPANGNHTGSEADAHAAPASPDLAAPAEPAASAKGLLAIIGGSGLYDLPGLTDTAWVEVDTPWGAPSDAVFTGTLATAVGPARLAFLPRHGRGHRLPPSAVNYRANIAALKQLGATDVVSLSAVGGLRADLAPGTFVLIDQYIDRTVGREKSFFGVGLVAHVSMAQPVCQRLGEHLHTALAGLGVPHARGGTYLAMEGPQFSTLAESRLYRSWNCDVIGMTNMPEAQLAREAELCYASVAMVTDFDCWHPAHEDVTVEAIVGVLMANADTARTLVARSAGAVVHDAAGAACICRHVLDHALITAPAARDPAMVARLRGIAGRVL